MSKMGPGSKMVVAAKFHIKFVPGNIHLDLIQMEAGFYGGQSKRWDRRSTFQCPLSNDIHFVVLDQSLSGAYLIVLLWGEGEN